MCVYVCLMDGLLSDDYKLGVDGTGWRLALRLRAGRRPASCDITRCLIMKGASHVHVYHELLMHVFADAVEMNFFLTSVHCYVL